jgi:membrane-bound ClpP family serine protease
VSIGFWDLVGYGLMFLFLYQFLKKIVVDVYVRYLEKKYDCVLLPIIHGRFSCIDEGTLQDVLDAIERARKEKKKLMIVLHTPGGYLFSAQRIADVLVEVKDIETVAVIPVYAMSGGTLIVLPVKRIIATDFAVVGSLDPQIRYEGSYLSIRDMVIVRDSVDEVNEKYATVVETGKRIIREMREQMIRYLSSFGLDDERVVEIVNEMLNRHSHSYGLLVREVLGFKFERMSDEMYRDVMRLVKLLK